MQPPGITLLMTPAALLAQVTGTAWGMAVGRILTVLASSAGILIVGLLVRHRGLIPVSLACGILAIFPGSVVAAHTVLLEPWLTLFCLIGALVLMDRDRFAASGRRLLWAGVAFGFAGAVEVWAILPVLVVAVLLVIQGVDRAARFVAGVAIGFLVPVVPFAVAAPARFYNSFFAAQLFRVVPARTPVEKRLRLMTGIGQVLHLGSTGVLILSLAIAAADRRRAAGDLAGHPAPADRPGLVRGRQLHADRGRVPLVRPVLPALPRVPGAVPGAVHRAGRGPADLAGAGWPARGGAGWSGRWPG